MSPRPLITVVCALLVGVGAGCGEDSIASDAPPQQSGPNDPSGSAGDDASLPAMFSVQEIRAEIEARRGKPLLVNYWAMWCAPCIAEMPDFLAAGREFEEQGGEVLIVAMDHFAPMDEPESLPRKLRDFLADRGWEATCLLWDGEAKPKEIVEALGPVTRLPTTTSYSKTGARVEVHEAKASLEEFRAMAERASAAN